MSSLTEDTAYDAVLDYVIGDFAKYERNQRYVTDPSAWAWDMLGIEFHHKQEEIALSVVHNHDTAVAAGHGTGKSLQVAVLALWWIDVHPIGTAYVATTAPSRDQISEVVFREMKKWYGIWQDRYEKQLVDHFLPGRMGEDDTWKVERGGRLTTVAKGRKPPDNKAGDAFQGIHATYVLAIGDEATGLSEEIIDGLNNITTNSTSRRVLICNPTNPHSHIGKIFLKPTGAWSLIHVSVFDLPTFHGGGKCKCHKGQPYGLGLRRETLADLSDYSFVEKKKKEYGEESARYKSRVLGQWAFDVGATLFTEYDMAKASDLAVWPDMEDQYTVIGVDVARFGDDSTYVYRCDTGVVMEQDEDARATNKPLLDENGEMVRGKRIRHVEHWKDAPFTNRTRVDENGKQWIELGTAERVHEIAMSIGAKEVRVDASGLGQGLLDPLYELSLNAGNPYIIVEMLGGAKSPDRRAWLNLRAYQMDTLRKEMMQGTVDLDPTDTELFEELSGILYEFADGASGGGLKIESKESMKRRGVKSPDAVDAVWYCFAEPDRGPLGPLGGLHVGDTMRMAPDDVMAYAPGWSDVIW